MAIQGARVTVGTSIAELSTTATDNTAGQHLLITNRGSVSIYLGPSSVTTSTGYELAVGDTLAVDLAQSERLYAIAGSAGQIVHVLRAGV